MNPPVGLKLEGLPAQDLARRFGTPLYVYSKRAVLERLWTLKAAFRQRPPLVCYALKANSTRGLCRILAREGAGAEVVSGGELARALAAGFESGKIVFSGVGKTQEELAFAVRKKILSINIESREELEALEKIAGRLKKNARISVRLNPNVDPHTHAHITTGLSDNKFGVERREALALYEKAKKSLHLRPVGIQCHIGSQIATIRPYAEAVEEVAAVMKELDRRGVRLELVDLGGGLGIADGGAPALDLGAWAKTISRVLGSWPKARLVVEPGRYLVAEAGWLLTTVLYRKETSTRRFIVVDAGMNDLARPALYGARHPVAAAVPRPGTMKTVDVVGPVCESGDFLARRARLGPCRPGDALVVGNCGAYGWAMSSQYNSRPRAAEVLVDGVKARVIRRREVLADLVRLER